MTSNLGAADAEKLKIGFGKNTKIDTDVAAVKSFFTPEFRNRLDAVIRFNKLDKGVVDEPDLDSSQIIDLYDKNVTETFELMLAKNHDYGEAWREMEVISLTDLIIQKLYRMKSILKNDGKTNVSEGIDANFQDILNYSVFAQILLKE